MVEVRWIAVWHELAGNGPDRGKKITIVSPSIEGAKKNGWPVPTARELAVVLHLVRRVDPSGIAEEYPWCHGLQRAEKHSAE